MRYHRYVCYVTLLFAASTAHAQLGPPQEPKGVDKQKLPKFEQIQFPPVPTILDNESRPIDLASALQLAGVQNPQIMLARERIVEAAALRQLAAAQFLPSINAGANFNHHQGSLQQSTGTMLKLNRDSLYVGLGANAVGAGTVGIPGIVWNGNVSATIYRSLVSRQIVAQREFASDAVRNEILLQVAQSYLELLRAEGRRAIAAKNRVDALEVARVTASYAKTGQGRQADADRAATELEQRNTDLLQAENEIISASARLSQVLSLNPSERLHPTDGWVVPQPIVPDPIPLPELVTIAITQRPELHERQAAIRAALLELKNAKVLPFSPNVILGYSAGGFGGGSNLVRDADPPQPRFSNLRERQDFDVVLFWSLRNLGVGNVAMVRLAQSNLRQNELQNTAVFDRVRAEVVLAYARTHARFAQIETSERAVQTSEKAFTQDFLRTMNREGLPIEVLDSMRLLGRSRYSYLDAIVDYNRAHFDLYVALGQPPADTLARPIPGKPAPPK
jgi:outer membrane protein TolC